VSGAFLEEGAPLFVKRRWVEALRSRGGFLQPGDRVVAEGAGLGAVVTAIEAPATSPERVTTGAR